MLRPTAETLHPADSQRTGPSPVKAPKIAVVLYVQREGSTDIFGELKKAGVPIIDVRRQASPSVSEETRKTVET